MAVTVVSYVYPALVAGLWAAMRRMRRPANLAPALFVAFAMAAILVVPAANGDHALALPALCTALAIGSAALADSAKPREDPGPPDDEGGGSGRPRSPKAPQGGDGWREFEEAFWAHVDELDAQRRR
jgi:hypothetical protein